MKMVVNKKETLVKVIARHTSMYTREQIAKIIEVEGAQFFNNHTGLNITYLGFGEWQIS